MKIYFFLSILMFTSNVAWAKMETSELILPLLNDPVSDEQNCERAVGMSKGQIEKDRCLEKLPAVKESCASALNNFIGMYISTVEQSKYVARTLILCQVWESLGYETITTENGVQYVKQSGGVLP